MSGTRIPVPANIEREDRILAGLSARQLAILAGAAALLWLGWQATRDWLPVPVVTAIGFPVAAAALAGAFGRADGTTVDRLALAAWRFRRGPRRLVPAPDGGVPAAPPWVQARTGRLPAPLRLPARAIDPDGTVDLGPHGQAALARCECLNFALLSPAEQDAAVAGYARWLNGLTGPAMVVSRAVPVDLSAWVAALRHAAATLTPATLAAAAADHAEFLAGLAAGADLAQRQVLLVVRHSAGSRDLGRAGRLAYEAARALDAAGVAVRVLNGPEVVHELGAACRPLQPPSRLGAADSDTIITIAGRAGRELS